MTKTYGPLFSLDASGTLAGAVTFSKWKGRNYVRQRVVPANPKSGLQVSVRAMLRFLSRQWASLSPENQSTWLNRASLSEISPFNAYTSANMSRWREFGAPGQADPVGETGTEPVLTFDSVVGGVHSADLTFTLTTANDFWGLVIFRSTSPSFTPSVSNAVFVLPAWTSGSFIWTDSNLDPGTYYWNARAFTADGKLGAAETERSATVI